MSRCDASAVRRGSHAAVQQERRRRVHLGVEILESRVLLDGQPTVQFGSIVNFSETAGSATIFVQLSAPSNQTVSVSYSTGNGSAIAGTDYTSTSGTLTFANGETSKTFTIPIINDTAVENAETVLLTLSNPTGGAALTTGAFAS